MNYRHTDRESSGQSLTAADLLMTDSVNSTRSHSWSHNNRLSGNGNLNVFYLTNTANDALGLEIQANGSKTYSPQSFSQSQYRYYKTLTTDDRNEYSDNAPKNYRYSAELGYQYNLSKHVRLVPYYREDVRQQ